MPDKPPSGLGHSMHDSSTGLCRPTMLSAIRGPPPEGDISPSGVPQRSEEQRPEIQRRPSWGTRQRHAKAKVGVDNARDVPEASSAAHALMSDPEGAAPQDAEKLFGCSQIFSPII